MMRTTYIMATLVVAWWCCLLAHNSSAACKLSCFDDVRWWNEGFANGLDYHAKSDVCIEYADTAVSGTCPGYAEGGGPDCEGAANIERAIVTGATRCCVTAEGTRGSNVPLTGTVGSYVEETLRHICGVATPPTP